MPLPPILALTLPLAGFAYTTTANNALVRMWCGQRPPSYTRPPRYRTSLICPAYNESRYIGLLLNSAMNQTESFSEIIVANCSDEEDQGQTASIAMDYGARVVQVPKGNISISRNTGAHHASGDILVFADADMMLCHEFLETCVSALEQGYAMVHPRRVMHDSILWNTLLWGVQNLRPKTMPGGLIAIWSSAFYEAGQYDESLYMGHPVGEDREFGVRVGQTFGWQNVAVLPVLIGSSARRFAKYGLLGGKHQHLETAVRSKIARISDMRDLT